MNDHDHKPPSPDFTIDLNVNVRFPGLAAIFQPQLNRIEGKIMTIQEDTQAIKDAAHAAADEVTRLNGKVDTLVVVATETKDALVNLQNSNAGATIDPAALTEIINTLTGAVTAATAEEAKVDAATTAVAP